MDSLRFSRHAYFIGTRREEFRLDLLTRLRRQALTAGAAPRAVPADVSAGTPIKEPA